MFLVGSRDSRSLFRPGKLLFHPSPDPEHMSVRMAYMHLANAPGHVRRWEDYFDSLFDTFAVRSVDVFDKPRHPHTFVGGLIAVGAERTRVRTFSASALPIVAQEDLRHARANGAKCRRVAPIPQLPPTQFLKP